MEYEVGSIADLISGNRTPNRPKVTKKPVTPVKPSTPPSKNVTPRENRNVGKLKTPKIALTPEVVRSPRVNAKNEYKNEFDSPKSTSKKRKSKSFSTLLSQQDQLESGGEENKKDELEVVKRKKKSLDIRNKSMSTIEDRPKIKEDKRKKEETLSISDSFTKKKNNDKSQERKKSKTKPFNISLIKKSKKRSIVVEDDVFRDVSKDSDVFTAIQGNQSETEHESDNQIAPSDNEDTVNKELTTADVSEDEQSEFKKAAALRVQQKVQREQKFDGQFLDRTLFVGNIPISVLKRNHERVLRSKFAPYGSIESIRIRNIPVPDLTTKPKLAFIEKNFHAERNTVIAYIVFVDAASVEKALLENNSILDGNHLRVDRCHSAKVPVDPRKSLFCGGLPFNVEEETLRSFFEGCGEIESVRIVRDRKTQMGKGIAFINFTSPDGVELALAMDEDSLKISNRQFRIKRYNTTDQGNRRENKNFGGNKKFEKDNKFGQLKKAFPSRSQTKFGKKRDDQGNKIRKRDADGKKSLNNKVDTASSDAPTMMLLQKKSDHQRSDGESVDEQKVGKSRAEKHMEYKGLIAKKKKKMKQSKSILEKKKLSKILTQAPKVLSDD